MVPTSKLIIILAFIGVSALLLILQPRAQTVVVNEGYDQAREDSFGYFDDIDNFEWAAIRKDAKKEPLFMHAYYPDKGNDWVGMWMLENMDAILTCPRQRRVGGRGEGGKWICDPHRLKSKPDCLVYSVGESVETVFEGALSDLLDSHCEIHVFSTTQLNKSNDDLKNKNIHYHSLSVTSSSADGTYSYDLQENMKKLGHAGRRLDVFKVDCEGCEWHSYKEWMSDDLDIRQFLVEIHATKIPKDVSLAAFFTDIASHGFVPYSKEAHSYLEPVGHFYDFSLIRMKPGFYDGAKFGRLGHPSVWAY